VADPDPGEPTSALTAWRAATLGSLIAWDLACAAVAAILLTWLGASSVGYRWLLGGGWALVAVLALLLLASRLEWRARAVLFLSVNYLVMLLTSSSPTPGAVAFSHAAAVVALSGLLLGGRAAAGAAVLVMATLSATAFAVGRGWAPARPPLEPAAEWMAALAGAFPPLVMVVLALHRIVDRLRDALSSTTRALRDLEATRSQVADSERAELAGRLATALAHDLNNTLTVVVAGAEWLAERLQDREEAEAAAQICEAARNASTLTQQVLLASGSGRSSPRTIDLARVATVAASALRRLLPPDIRVETRVDGPVWTVLDPGQLQQIILGMALNARAAMPGGGTLLVAVRPGGAAPASPGEPPPAAILEISDTGFGMDAEERRRAFEPLSDRSVRRGGVGLSSVKGLVEAAGGQVLLRSRPGTGTVVTLSLPGALPAAPGPTPPGPSRPARVLVVEDDIRVRALVCTALTGSGHEVSDVSDGTQAMRAIEELGAIDLLVTDVVMPGAPVGEVIATFRARHPGGKVLLCSAFSQDEALRQDGVRGHRLLRKPFTRSELLAEVQALLADAAAGDRPAAARAGLPV
jgi:signal transduction histidine kinase